MTQPSPADGPSTPEAWHRRPIEDVLAGLRSAAAGLSAAEAAKRLAADGPNELKEGKRIGPLQIFLGQFKSLIVWILIAAGVISGVLGEVIDASAILAIVVLNAAIGFYQEYSAEKSIAALKKMTAPQARVRRDGKIISIPAGDIVRGDILALEAGDLVAADARLLTAASLRCVEAALTGELLLMTVCVILGLPTPLLPIHLLWINLVTDGLPALCLATDPIDPAVMAREPRHRSERITNRGFLRTMFFTGFLTAGVAFAVYLHVLTTGTEETARTYAFAVLVFAELLRSFGARSETVPVWRISLLTNLNLALVVAGSFGLQVWSHHSATLARFLKTSSMSFADCCGLLALGSIPLLTLELAKLVRNRRHRAAPAGAPAAATARG